MKKHHEKTSGNPSSARAAMTRQFIFQDRYAVKIREFPATAAQSSDIVLVLLPEFGIPVGHYGYFIRELNAEGYAVITADYPCCGANTPPVSRDTDYGWQMLAEDFVPRLLHAADNPHAVLFGHGFGGELAAHYSRNNPDTPLFLIGAGNPRYGVCAAAGAWRANPAVWLKTLVRGYLPAGGGLAQDMPRTLVRNRCYTARSGKYPGAADTRSDAPVVLVHLRHPLQTPLPAVQALAKSFSRAMIVETELTLDAGADCHSWLDAPESLCSVLVQYLPA